MIGIRVLAAALVAAGFAAWAGAQATVQPVPDDEARQLATDVKSVFAARCADCHQQGVGTRVERRFDFILDLPRLKAEEEMIVPGDPLGSDLWFTIEVGDMPPKDTHTGKLSDAEKRVIRAWIEAGAPLPTATETASADEPVLGPRTPEPVADDGTVSWLELFGRMHVMSVHLPIALVLAALLAEVLRLFWGVPGMGVTATYCLILGGAGAVMAAAMGWVFRGERTFVGDRLEMITLHQWSGTAVAGVVVLAAVLSVFPRHRTPGWTLLYRAVLLIAAVGIGLTAHWGGESVYGVDFLPW